MTGSSFDWDEEKNRLNQEKHGVAFEIAQLAFLDSHRVIADDVDHSTEEKTSDGSIASDGSRMGAYSALHGPGWTHSNFWSRLLAKRQEDL